MCVDSWNVSGSAGHGEILSPESDPDAPGIDLRPSSSVIYIYNLCAKAYGD